MPNTRRGFLATAASLAAAGRTAEGAAAPLPMVKLGKYEMSRLVLGSNPLGGASHFNPILDQHMREWMTPERILEILQRAEQAGIRTWQLHNDPKLMECQRKYRDGGGKMNFLMLSDFKDPRGTLGQYKDMGLAGIAFHGERSDVLFREGQFDQVHDFLKAVHDMGLMAGISMHNPAVLDLVEGKGWEVDYYMTCVYRRSRTPAEVRAEFREATMGEPYFEGDPARMCKMIRQAKKTCFAFKILAAGRNIKGQPAVDQAFRFVFENIKPTDGVIVGMYPRFKDEITQNANLTRRFGSPA
jgi:hypothetical protein